jgi:hypothetical protein
MSGRSVRARSRVSKNSRFGACAIRRQLARPLVDRGPHVGASLGPDRLHVLRSQHIVASRLAFPHLVEVRVHRQLGDDGNAQGIHHPLPSPQMFGEQLRRRYVSMPRPEEGLLHFGADRGDFITFHIDSNLSLDTKVFGVHLVQNLQNPVWWVSGSGSAEPSKTTEDWTVKVLK